MRYRTLEADQKPPAQAPARVATASPGARCRDASRAPTHNASAENIGPLVKFIKRMPEEMQVVTLREVVRRNKMMLGHPDIQAWINESATSLF